MGALAEWRFESFNDLDVTTCINCGIPFTSPIMRQRRKDGGTIWCPNGHGQSWTVTAVQKEKERLEKEVERLKTDIEWQRSQRQTAEKSMIAMKGQVTKLKKRVANGVCPCCQRQFANLHRHMTTQHPDFAPAPKPPAEDAN